MGLALATLAFGTHLEFLMSMPCKKKNKDAALPSAIIKQNPEIQRYPAIITLTPPVHVKRKKSCFFSLMEHDTFKLGQLGRYNCFINQLQGGLLHQIPHAKLLPQWGEQSGHAFIANTNPRVTLFYFFYPPEND